MYPKRRIKSEKLYLPKFAPRSWYDAPVDDLVPKKEHLAGSSALETTDFNRGSVVDAHHHGTPCLLPESKHVQHHQRRR
jgi:hypothetical protein